MVTSKCLILYVPLVSILGFKSWASSYAQFASIFMITNPATMYP